MNFLTEGAEVPHLVAEDEVGKVISIPSPNSWVHIWFNPIFGRFGCKTCQTSLMHEKYPDFRVLDCEVVGATFDPQDVRIRRNKGHSWRVPLIQVSREEAREWGALHNESSSWYKVAPLSVAYLIDDRGIILRTYRDIDHRHHA
ncbi:MAG: peroxiredoxin family protein, partial [Actinobacteria bacterium]|nr:peroxiredoxin family protein [Actinomycetota bacterium]